MSANTKPEATFGWREAEAATGRRLDRRKRYTLWLGEVCTIERCTLPCSGCRCDTEYPCGCCRERGAGCDECGYTGKRVQEFPVPVKHLHSLRRANILAAAPKTKNR